MSKVPVITVDGPTGSGKGTISQLLAQKLGWHFLDSGALYRVLALNAKKHTIPFDDEAALENLAIQLNVKFVTELENVTAKIILESVDVTDEIRSEECGNIASKIAAFAGVRNALVARQQAFRQEPGLVADGRDMGSVIFPDAIVKVFLMATPEERAQRRFNQLKQRGINANLNKILEELLVRDKRDKERKAAPLKPAKDAILIDTSGQSIQEVFAKILKVITDKIGDF